jgi:drug/metabolite transporter (DMT)-like permease
LTVIAARYALTHGFAPIAFTALRQIGSTAIIVAFCLKSERSLAIGRDARPLAAVAMLLGFANQVCLVYAVHLTSASTVGLVLGTVPIITMLIAAALAIEPLTARGAAAATVSFLGVMLISISVGQIAGGIAGAAFALLTAATWAGYSVVIARLSRYASPMRLSAAVMLGYTPLLVVVAAPQLAAEDYASVSPAVWACVIGVAIAVGIATPIWYYAIETVGPSRATLFANFQPFLVVVLGVLLLSETLTVSTILGGAAIACGLWIAWRARTRVVA